MAEAKVCFDRLTQFLLLPEYEKPSESEDFDNFAIAFEDFNAARDLQQQPLENGKNEPEKESLIKDNSDSSVQVLFNVNLKIEHGKLIGVAGGVGSGKSSLISAIMGELKCLNGRAKVNGRLALVPQQAWIFSGTVRENILFGSRYEESVFNQVIEATALKEDIDNWPNKDQTEVGERGLSLSGGQKQRISLCRAIYAVLDDQRVEKAKFVVLLDDPLSAVDPGVAKHIYDQAISTLLRDHTVILVTHGVQFLSKCDLVAFMKNGSITELGTYDDLARSGSDFANMVSYDQSQKMDKVKEEQQQSENGASRSKRSMSTVSNVQQTLVQDEIDQVDVGWSVLLKYFKVSLLNTEQLYSENAHDYHNFTRD